MTKSSKRQLGLLPAAGDYSLPSAQSPQGTSGHLLQFPEVVGAKIAHVMFLQLPPQVLDRVEFRSVSGQPLLLNASLPGQVVLHQPAAVSGQAVPDQNHFAPQGAAASAPGTSPPAVP